jgi:transposase
MDKRLYPVTPDFFNSEIKPLIDQCYSAAGRPRKVSDYQVFCGILYVLRTGIPWRDLPKCYGYWHTVYLRFNKGSKRGVWWYVLKHLQQRKKLKLNIVLGDSTTFKVHRHGGGQKGGIAVGEKAELESPQNYTGP